MEDGLSLSKCIFPSMRWLKSQFRKHPLVFGAVLLLGPLLALSWNQFSQLGTVREATALALKNRRNLHLENVADNIAIYYNRQSQELLNVPSWAFFPGKLGRAAEHFAESRLEAVSHAFVVTLQEPRWRVLFYDPATKSFENPGNIAAVEVIRTKATPWKITSAVRRKASRLENRVHVLEDLYDSDAPRIVMRPILDDESRIVGAAGFILSEEYFEQSLIPSIFNTQDTFLKDYVITSLIDPDGRVVYSTLPMTDAKISAQVPLYEYFSGYKLTARHDVGSPYEMAQRQFRTSVMWLTGVVAVLFGAIMLFLQATSREIKLSQMKSDFVSNVSHELRTPLASIRAFGELMMSGRVQSQEKVVEYGEYIETEGRRLTQLINNILDFSKIESGTKSYRFELGDVTELVQSVVESFTMRLKRDGFDVELELPPDPLPAIHHDRDAVRQAINNLIDNAVKYSKDVQRVRVHVFQRSGEIVISVRDWGIGIPKSDLAKIFDRFHRVSTGLVHEVRGNGLGLAIVKHVAEVHGGRVEVESELGEGSTFSVYLPIQSVATQPSGLGSQEVDLTPNSTA